MGALRRSSRLAEGVCVLVATLIVAGFLTPICYAQEKSTVRRAVQVSTLLKQRYGKERVGAVVSRYDARADIGQDDIERAAGLPVWAVLPSDYRRAVAAANAGRPVVSETNNRLAAAIQELARKLAGMAPDASAVAKPAKRRAGGIF